MKRLSLLSIISLSLVAAGVVPLLNADPVKLRTEVTFSQPTEIPGLVLEPGTYVMKVPDPVTHRDMVGFYNPDESHLYKLVRAIPAYRLDVTDKTVITFEERANGAPEAIKKWFTPSDHHGYEFVYSKAETLPRVAENTPPPAPSRPAAPAAVAAPQPASRLVAKTPPPQQPVQVAQAKPAPTPAQAPAQPAPRELPKTASDLPLLFEAGAVLIFAGLCLRVKA